MMKTQRQPEIDGLRAIAILWVLAAHLPTKWAQGGYVGVDLFFVLSGYLITRLILEQIRSGSFSFLEFYLRRGRRLIPALYGTVAVSTLVAFLYLVPYHFRLYSQTLLYVLGYASNFHFSTTAPYFFPPTFINPFVHTWTLAVEEQVYLFWPILLFGLSRIRKANGVAWGIALLSVFSLAALVWAPYNSVQKFYLAPFRLFEFGIGAAALGLEKFRIKSTKWNDFLCALCLCAYVYFLFGYGPNEAIPNLTGVLPVLVSGVLVFCVSSSSLFMRAMNTPFLQWLGLRSYSIYLVHWPIFIFYRYCNADPQYGALEIIGLLALSLLLGQLLFATVEYPFHRGRALRLSAGKFGLLYLGTTLILGLLAWRIDEQAGWKWRVASVKVPHSLNHPTEFEKYRPKQLGFNGKRNFYFEGAHVGELKSPRKRMLVLGDSNALMFSPGLNYLGKKYGVEVEILSVSGCPPMLTCGARMARDGLPRCAGVSSAWKKYLEKNTYDFLLLSSRWDAFKAHKFSCDEKHFTRSVASTQKMEESLEKTLQWLERRPERTFILGTIPNLRQYYFQCGKPPNAFSEWLPDIPRCRTMKREAVQKFTERERKVYGKIAKRHGVAWIDPLKILCYRTECPTYHYEVPLYLDATHLSEHGSLWFVQRWEKSPDFPFKALKGLGRETSP